MAAKSAKATGNEPPVTRIVLERPASIRRLLPALTDGWTLPDYLVGSENKPLRYLFDDKTIQSLHDLSPVVLYGDKHLGKTPLAITLAVRWSRLSKLRPLCFTTGSAFVDDYVAAIEIDDIDSFRRRHRECKMLVIDDLDPFVTKPAAQDELAATLDHHSTLGQPVILTVSRLPASLKGLKPPLISRLSSGFSLGLAKPASETRDELVRLLVRANDSGLPEDDLVALAAQLTHSDPLSAFELRDIVTLAQQNMSSTKTVDLTVVALLARQLRSGEAPSIPAIAKAVARKMRVKLVDLRGTTRQANIIRARGLAILLSRKLTPSSLQQIGEFFGGRDHSTILHAFRKAERLLDSDTELANFARDIQTEILP